MYNNQLRIVKTCDVARPTHARDTVFYLDANLLASRRARSPTMESPQSERKTLLFRRIWPPLEMRNIRSDARYAAAVVALVALGNDLMKPFQCAAAKATTSDVTTS